MLFPTHFSQQSLLLTFDLYDTSKDNDYVNIDRIAKNLEAKDEVQDKSSAISQMQRISDMESKKSLLGKISAETWQKTDLQNQARLEECARDNHLSEAFFTFERSQYRLKEADWLPHVCFEGNVSEAVKRQSHYFNSVDQYDSLLESAFNFLDVNDLGSVNRILEESANTHV